MNENEIFNFLSLLADESARITLANFRNTIEIFNKNNQTTKVDPVTEVDQKSELLIRQLIEKKYPEHSILGEEFDDIERDPRFRWYIDPIDGTKSFLSGIPLWGTLIGLEVDGIPKYGLIDNPATKERYIGSLNKVYKITAKSKKIIKTNNNVNINNIKFGYTTDEMFDNERSKNVLNKVNQRVAFTRTGGDCYFYGLLASGFMDLIIESQLKPYDIIPIVPIIKGAGGMITNWNGEDSFMDGNIIASSNSKIHEFILDLIKGYLDE
tara:strand:+ start:3019 stop:3819 length:801 start_codon:yes stop_codon:yes gene_type:complete